MALGPAGIAGGRSRQPVFEDVENGYLPKILDEIEELAIIKAGGSNYSYIDVVRAFEEFFNAPAAPPKVTPYSFFQDNLFIIVCAVLAIAFGVMGWKSTGATSSGFLDIAKIFAGALVGGAATKVGSAVGTARSPTRSPKKRTTEIAGD